MIAAAAAAGGGARLRRGPAAATATGLALAVFAAATLVLTVAPIPDHPQLPHTALRKSNPAPDYATALGGSGTIYFDEYRLATSLPAFVGPAAYHGEQLLLWLLISSRADYLGYAVGMYHDGFNRLPSYSPDLTRRDRQKLRSRRPAELLFVGRSAASFPQALRALAAFRPALLRAGELRAGPLVLHAWIVRLGVYYHPPARSSATSSRA